jgi:hypothetical protein
MPLPFRDDLKGAFELLHAVAVASAKRFARHARGVESGVERLCSDDVAVRKCDNVVLVDDILENVGAEAAESRIERTAGDKKRLTIERSSFECSRSKYRARCVLNLFDQRIEPWTEVRIGDLGRLRGGEGS